MISTYYLVTNIIQCEVSSDIWGKVMGGCSTITRANLCQSRHSKRYKPQQWGSCTVKCTVDSSDILWYPSKVVLVAHNFSYTVGLLWKFDPRDVNWVLLMLKFEL